MDRNQKNLNQRTEIRTKPLVLSISGQVPTLPKPLNLGINQNGWRLTDLANGEYCINDKDDIFYYRSNDQIIALSYSLILTFIINSNVIFGNSNAGLLYKIPTGTNVIVKNNHQYLVKDNLYLTGGSITMQGNAQLVIH